MVDISLKALDQFLRSKRGKNLSDGIVTNLLKEAIRSAIPI